MTKHILNSEIGLQSFIGTLRELWRDIPGLEGRYQASSFGRIRSLDRVGATCYGASRSLKGRVLSVRAGKSGYVRITSGIGDTQLVHRLVAMAFLPNPNSLPAINHKDGNKANNVPGNLEWCTQAHNVQHAITTGLAPKQITGCGEKSIASKLTDSQVREIRIRLSNGDTSAQVARDYGVVKGTIREIKAGRTWSHLQ